MKGIDQTRIIGVNGEGFHAPIAEQVKVLGNDKEIIPSFVIIPEVGTNLLGRDLQVQLGIGVIPKEDGRLVKLFKLTIKD